MGRRTFTAYSLEFYKSRHPDESFAPADLDGLDLLDEFERWCKNLRPDELLDFENNRYVQVGKIERQGRFVLAEVEVGVWGEPGNVIDHSSGVVVAPIADDEAPTGMTRAALYVPKPGETALFFCEYSGRGSGGARLLWAFSSFWSHNYDFTMKREAVTESEVWDKEAELREVELRIRQRSSDIADPTEETRAILSYSLKAPRRKRLRLSLLTELKQRPDAAAALFGMDHMPNDSEVLVALRNQSGREKKFVLGEAERLPSLREELNSPGEPILDNSAFLERCQAKASDLLDRL